MGIVTDRDLFIALGTSDRRASELLVSEVMRTDGSTCRPDDEIETASSAMTQRQLERLPVVDAFGILQGVISMDDMAGPAGGGSAGLRQQTHRDA